MKNFLLQVVFVMFFILGCSPSSTGKPKIGGDQKLSNADFTPPNPSLKKIYTDYNQVCVITTSDTVDCWGDNTQGQSEVPKDLKGVKHLAIGPKTVCAQTEAGIRCWGKKLPDTYPIPKSQLQFDQLIAGFGLTGGWGGGGYFCGLQKGEVFCWGALGAPKYLTNDVQSISSDWNGPCAVHGPNRIVTCWGYRTMESPNTDPHAIKYLSQFNGAKEFMSSSGGDCAIFGAELKCLSEFFTKIFLDVQLVNPKNLQVNGKDVCVEDQGRILCWRYRTDPPSYELPPASVPNSSSVSLGGHYYCIMQSDGSLSCKGKFDSGVSTMPVYVPERYGGNTPSLPTPIMKPLSPKYCGTAKVPDTCFNYTGSWVAEALGGNTIGYAMYVGQVDCKSINIFEQEDGTPRFKFNFNIWNLNVPLDGSPKYIGHDIEGVDTFVSACFGGGSLFVERLFDDHTELYQLTGSKLCYRNFKSGDTFENCEFVRRLKTW